MPIYEYECQSCGQRFDVMQKFTDEPVSECKFCKGGVRKLMGTPALQFKGTGWYVTDYAGKSPKPGEANKPSSGTTSEAAPKAADGAAAPPVPAHQGPAARSSPMSRTPPVKPKVHIHVPYSEFKRYEAFLRENRSSIELYLNTSAIDGITEADLHALKDSLDWEHTLSIHGPFMDLSPGAVDSKVAEASLYRYMQVLSFSEILKPERHRLSFRVRTLEICGECRAVACAVPEDLAACSGEGGEGRDKDSHREHRGHRASPSETARGEDGPPAFRPLL